VNEAETRAELIDPALRYADRGLRHPHRRAGAGEAISLWRSDRGQDAPDQHRRNRPAGAGEEADAEPDADLIEVDGGWHVGPSRWSRVSLWSRGSLSVARIGR
jgi:hypothetical protein